MRLFWFDQTGKLSEYRIKVHVFWAESSPSVANFTLKRTAIESECTVETKNSILRGSDWEKWSKLSNFCFLLKKSLQVWGHYVPNF